MLLVEDSPTDAKLVLNELLKLKRPLEHERVDTADAMRAALARRPIALVLSDWSMPAFSALAALAIVKELRLDLPFIIVSGTIGEDTAVDAMRAGAHDYVLKDRLVRLTPAIERELRECEDRVARRRAEEALRQSQEQLRQAQKMEAVGRLAGGVAHDFNNVLSVILSYGEVLLEDLKTSDPIRADIAEICKAAKRAAGLTRQLLLFSRQQVLSPRVIELYDSIRGMAKMLQRIVGEDVELVLVAPATDARVCVDPTHIEQVVVNLVVNARDAMPTGGKLTLEVVSVTLDEDYALGHLPVKAGRYVMLALTDTGTGMDRETQLRIFEPFFTTKEQGKGTGLGLSTVFGIVQQSGGYVWVYSELGRGTTFKIYLPRVDSAVEGIDAEFTPTELAGSETILLVEDEAQVRVAVLNLLRRQGYRVIAAAHAEEALLLAQGHVGEIHLLLTDVVMPRTSGPELAKRLLVQRPNVKVLYMSGYTDDSVARHGVLTAGVPFIQKPITPAVLAKKVRAVLDGSALESKAAPPP